MNPLIKKYKGVDIYLNSTSGHFYANINNSSNLFKDKTFSCEKMSAMEEGIKNHRGTEVENGKEYYHINTFSHIITLLKVVRNVGTRVFFDDGSDSIQYARQELFPKDVENHLSFSIIKEKIEASRAISQEINILIKKQNELRYQANHELKNLQLVVPTK